MGWAETMAFWDAVDHGSIAGMQAAVRDGADVDHYHAGLSTALHRCSERGDASMGSALIESGAGVNLRTRIGNDTALILAAERGRAAVVRVLLKQGADQSIKNARGLTARAVATDKGHTEVIEMLTAGVKRPAVAYDRLSQSIKAAARPSPGAPRRSSSLALSPLRSASRSAEGQAQTDARMVVYCVDPKDRRQSSILREVARFELRLEPGVTSEQLVQQTLAVLASSEGGVRLHKAVLLADGQEVTDRSGLVSRLPSHRSLRLLGMLSEGWAAGFSPGAQSPYTTLPGVASPGHEGTPATRSRQFTLEIAPSTAEPGGARAALVVDEAVPPPDTQPRAPQREEAVARTLSFFQEEEASAVFSKLESGGANRGVLDREQVMDRLGKIMGKEMSKSELLAAFEEMDIDGDGYVT